ncbi:helix-turn-helix domain-containing protein [Ruegeria sp.]|uniref:helix-turn-helix domain-containing protein n=1 Tax=Ruegeria sp. TaxID=1879320 RepID=UPI003AFF8440
MQELWKQLGSPRNLVVFEAAARLQSFTRAAQELNVQQPAVSVAIRRLEEGLGTPLFLTSDLFVDLTGFLVCFQVWLLRGAL